MTSGGAWCIEAVITPERVSCPPEIRAMPKSVRRASPKADMSTFAGLMSRWITSARWAVSRAPARCTP